MEEFNDRGEGNFADNNFSRQDQDDDSSDEEDDREVLEIGFDSYQPRDGDWERYGRVIGRMTRLRELLFYELVERVMTGDFASIFDGIAANRSVRKLTFQYCGLFDQDVFRVLTPFFENNANFRSLELEGCDLGREGLRFLAGALAAFASLEEFELSQCIQDDGGSYVRALMGHPGLRKLSLHETRLGREGFAALSALLSRPDAKGLALLELTDDVLDDDAVSVLEPGLAGNRALRALDLRKNPSVTEKGWGVFFATLRCPGCRLETLFLQENNINDAAELSLASSLTKNGTLKALDLSCRRVSSGKHLFEFLRSPNCSVQELHLYDNELTEESTIYLAYSLIKNRSLKSLDMSTCRITKKGWKALSCVLLDPRSALENLRLSSCEMNDEAVARIANGLASNRKLRELELRNNFAVTAGGWAAFFSVLRRPASALTKLDISCGNVCDDVAILLADALSGNETLVELEAGLMNWNITGRGWAAFARVLCDGTSIPSTHRSNHTLRKLCQDDMEFTLPKDIKSLLMLNRENGRARAARLKIIRAHFSGGHVNILPFADMERGVLPFVLAWMARDCAPGPKDGTTCGNGVSLLYQFVQNITAFFDFGGSDTSWVGSDRTKRRRIV